MNRKVLSILTLSLTYWAFAQKTDSLAGKIKSIEEVVVTGQYNAQSVNKSVYKVEVINEAQIKNMAATNVAEVLNQSLNMQITPDSKSGNSTANILGLDGNYVKILIDNIPVVGDTGLGSNIDLTKLSLINIERIEIVMGSMGVEYGSGAFAGVINIITKKSSSQKISGRASLQEESVRDQYDIRKKGNGRHIQNLNLNYNIDENWYASVSVNHNQFLGYQGHKKGYKYFEMDNNRGYDWNPKDQYDANVLLRYSHKNTSIFYKASFLKETFNYYNPKVERVALNDGNGGVTYNSLDRDYNTKRWIHQLNIQSRFGNIKYSGDFSYQSQDRKYTDFVYDIPRRSVISQQEEQSYYKTDVFYSRGLFSNFLNNKTLDFQLGYELDRTSGYAALIAGDFFGDAVKRNIFTYANFISAEWNITKDWSVRPGARLSISDYFDNQFNYSFSTRFKTSENSNLRGVFGTANKLPTYDELFTYFVNTNHDIQGNPNLKPEEGYSVGVFWDHTIKNTNDWKISYAANALFLDAKDRIEMVMVKLPSTYQYLNIDKHKSILFSAHVDFKKDNFSLGIKTSVNGISRALQDMDSASPTDFQYNFQAGLSSTYKVNNWKTLLALYYKYSGSESRYVNTGSSYILGKIGSFHMMDFIMSQPFWKDKMELSLGVKNIFDVTTINDTTTAASGHNLASGNLNLFYGRSYFARLSYQF